MQITKVSIIDANQLNPINSKDTIHFHLIMYLETRSWNGY